MNLIAVEDEEFALLELQQAIAEAAPEEMLHCFAVPRDALRHAHGNPVDVAFLDIHMGGMTGLDLAMQLQELNPAVNIIFVTGHADYYPDAFRLRASGCLLKPVNANAIRNELDNLRYSVLQEDSSKLRVQCFGSFEVFAGGKPLHFTRKKTKELFAYLVSRRGAHCSNEELAAVIWEDHPNTGTLQSNLRNLVSDLAKTLKAAGAESVLDKGRGSLAVLTDQLDCDYYRFMNGERQAGRTFTGEFMSQYSWAEFMIGQFERL